MDKRETCRYLEEQGICYELVEHPAVFTAAEAEALDLPHPEAGAKNLFLRDDKKKHYYLITLRNDLTVDLKQIQNEIGYRRLSFASEEDLWEILRLRKGSVTPLGLLHDTEGRTQFYLDRYFNGRLIAVHPNENTATVFLQTEALLGLLRGRGVSAEYVELV